MRPAAPTISTSSRALVELLSPRGAEPGDLHRPPLLERRVPRGRALPKAAGLVSVLGALLVLPLHGCAASSEPLVSSLDCGDCSLVLISIDTLRADHLGAWGYPRETSPRLDGLAAEGIRFGSAYSTSYHTADSHMSVFTALHPSVHGVRNAPSADQAVTLGEGIATVTERLRAAGFGTYGYHAGGNVSRAFGFGRGFDEYVWTNSLIEPVLERLDELRSRPAERFFLFFHTYRPHDPYLPESPFDRAGEADYRGSIITTADELDRLSSGGDFAERRRLFWSRVDRERPEDLRKVVALYDGEIRQVDQEVGKILDRLDQLPQRTLVAFMSDHGEEFQEHGRFLHDQLYNELLHVPLILRHPDRARPGAVVETPVSLVDLAPTLLDLLEAPALERAQGKSLRPLLEGARAEAPRPIFAEKVHGIDPETGDVLGLNRALIARNRKLLRLASGETHLFDLESDPGETIDLAGARPEVLAGLLEALDRRSASNAVLRRQLRAGAGLPTLPLDAETIEQLRALGYLQ